MMTRAKLALAYGVMGLVAGSFALAHVPPDPPQHPMGDMPYPKMAAMMQMDDTARTGMVLIDQLEWRNTAEGNALAWDAEGWYGGDTNKVWLRSEGERVAGTTQNARADLLWDHTFARWWSVQAGGRQDFGRGPSRTWAAARRATAAPGFASSRDGGGRPILAAHRRVRKSRQ